MRLAGAGWLLTAGEHAPLVADDQRLPEVGAEQPAGTPDVDDLTRPAEDHRKQVGVTGQPPSRPGTQPFTRTHEDRVGQTLAEGVEVEQHRDPRSVAPVVGPDAARGVGVDHGHQGVGAPGVEGDPVAARPGDGGAGGDRLDHFTQYFTVDQGEFRRDQQGSLPVRGPAQGPGPVGFSLVSGQPVRVGLVRDFRGGDHVQRRLGQPGQALRVELGREAEHRRLGRLYLIGVEVDGQTVEDPDDRGGLLGRHRPRRQGEVRPCEPGGHRRGDDDLAPCGAQAQVVRAAQPGRGVDAALRETTRAGVRTR